VVVRFAIGDPASVDAGERFHITVPVLRESDAEIQIRATDRTSGQEYGLIVPAGASDLTTHLGGLKIATSYPEEIVFMRCGNQERTLIDRQALITPPLDDRCER